MVRKYLTQSGTYYFLDYLYGVVCTESRHGRWRSWKFNSVHNAFCNDYMTQSPHVVSLANSVSPYHGKIVKNLYHAICF